MKATPPTKEEKQKYHSYFVLASGWGHVPKPIEEWLDNYRTVQSRLKGNTAGTTPPQVFEKKEEKTTPLVVFEKTQPKNGRVQCFGCGQEQADRGKRKTCIACGFQPLPSYAYESDSCFHPRNK